jgi:hypothetical protein
VIDGHKRRTATSLMNLSFIERPRVQSSVVSDSPVERGATKVLQEISVLRKNSVNRTDVGPSRSDCVGGVIREDGS